MMIYGRGHRLRRYPPCAFVRGKYLSCCRDFLLVEKYHMVFYFLRKTRKFVKIMKWRREK